MGFFFPDPPPPRPNLNPAQPPASQIAPVSPDLAPWFQADQIGHGLANAQAEAMRRHRLTGGNPLPPNPPGFYR